MKKTAINILPFAVLAVAATATSCSNDNVAAEGAIDGESKTVELTAKMSDNATTRIGMSKNSDGTASFYWHSDDAIFVATKNGDKYSGAKFTTGVTTGVTEATFKGTVATGASILYAAYPYNANHKVVSNASLTYNLPSTYTYADVDDGIFPEKTQEGTGTTYRINSASIPMIGTVGNENTINFKHIGGLAVIRINQMPAAEGTLTVTADEQLCGDFSCDPTATTPTIATKTGSDDNKTVTFSFTGADNGKAGVFYLPLATGSYSDLTIAITYGDKTSTVKYGNLYVARGSVNGIGLYTIGNDLSKFTSLDSNGNYTIGDYTFVDLDLKSGTLWATKNVGAASASNYGSYYAWGEIETKTDYSDSSYKFGTISGYTKYKSADEKKTLEAEDDVVTRTWGKGFRMPTKADFEELVKECTWEWTTQDEVYGCKVTGKNSKSIFLPAAGDYQDATCQNKASMGHYWASTISSDNYDYGGYLVFNKSTGSSSETTAYMAVGGSNRYNGFSVRPVSSK